MSPFETRTLLWRESEVRIPANRIFGAIESIEQHVTRTQLIEAICAGTVPYTKLARAWSAVLRYGGAKATNDEAYAELSKKELGTAVLDEPPVQVSLALLSIMLLPRELETFMQKLKEVLGGGEIAVEVPAVLEPPLAGKAEPAASTLPKKRTKSLSAVGASSPSNSGH